MPLLIRVRPTSQKEKKDPRSWDVVKFLDDKVICFDPSDNENADRRGVPAHARNCKDTNYAFDHVFNEFASQEEIYHATAAKLLNFVMQGYNATVFAYGATGSGKTHTMLGDYSFETNTIQNPGVIVQTLEDLFAKADASKGETMYSFCISYLEVYNETIRDLLADSSQKSKPLDLREDSKGMKVAGLTTHDVKSLKDVMTLLNQGNSLRAQSATEANPVSSRSHAVLQVLISSKPRTANVKTSIKVGKLSLIDLAGSERACVTKNRGRLLLEGANINRSLLALGNCINALGDPTNKASYVNYRDSKLTRLLKDSLGGNSKTVMITNISPSSLSYEETHNTLKYANRAKNIKTTATRNEVAVEMHIHEYKQIIADLRSEISELKTALTEVREQSTTDMPIDKDEEASVEKLRSEMSLAFQERQHITKSIMDLEDMEWESRFEMRKTKAELFRVQHTTRTIAETPLKKKMHGSLEKLEDDIRSNQLLKERLQKRLEKSIEATQTMQDLVDQITSDYGRTILDAEIRMQLLELDKLELEHRNQDQERELLLKRLQQDEKDMTMSMMQEVIEEQYALLRVNNAVDSRIQQGFELVQHLMNAGCETVPAFMNTSKSPATPTAPDSAGKKRKHAQPRQDFKMEVGNENGFSCVSPVLCMSEMSLQSPTKSPKITPKFRPSHANAAANMNANVNAPRNVKPASVWMDAQAKVSNTGSRKGTVLHASRSYASMHGNAGNGQPGTKFPTILKDRKNIVGSEDSNTSNSSMEQHVAKKNMRYKVLRRASEAALKPR
jgi:kinesin family member 18/19